MEHKLKLVTNAAGRKVPTTVNGMEAVPYKGVGKYAPKGVKAAPPIRTCNNYPASGNKIANSSPPQREIISLLRTQELKR